MAQECRDIDLARRVESVWLVVSSLRIITSCVTLSHESGVFLRRSERTILEFAEVLRI